MAGLGGIYFVPELIALLPLLLIKLPRKFFMDLIP